VVHNRDSVEFLDVEDYNQSREGRRISRHEAEAAIEPALGGL
jgi:hypothetical protein